MEQEKKKNMVIALLVAIIIILLTLVVLLATGIVSFEHNSNNDNDTIDNTNTTEQITVAQVNSFIISDNFISTHNVVADNMPDGYVFLSNGKFAYYNSSFNYRFVESEENRLISFIGTWSTNGSKLFLNVNKEEYAVGGKINETPAGNYLSDYTKEVRDVDKTIEYIVNKIDNTSEYLPFISLSLNGTEVKWYSLPGLGQYLNTPRALAENGYN